jgi:hypothetical protein
MRQNSSVWTRVCRNLRRDVPKTLLGHWQCDRVELEKSCFSREISSCLHPTKVVNLLKGVNLCLFWRLIDISVIISFSLISLVCNFSCIHFTDYVCEDGNRKLAQENPWSLIFFFNLSNVDLYDSRFIVLPDCHHIFELTSLEKWFKSQAENVEAKSCPSCSKRVSVKLLRFRSAVLEPFADWNTIALPWCSGVVHSPNRN